MGSEMLVFLPPTAVAMLFFVCPSPFFLVLALLIWGLFWGLSSPSVSPSDPEWLFLSQASLL